MDACRSITYGCQGSRVIFVSLLVSSPMLNKMFMPIIGMKLKILGIKKWTIFTIPLLFVVVMESLSRMIVSYGELVFFIWFFNWVKKWCRTGCLIFYLWMTHWSFARLIVNIFVICKSIFMPWSGFGVKDSFIELIDNSSWWGGRCGKFGKSSQVYH